MSAEDIIAKGRLFELVHIKQDDGRVFEVARRAPGVRMIIFDKENQKLLLTKEFRHELNDWDYRLPGGKVFDNLNDFETHRARGDDMLDAAKGQAIIEARQEAGIDITNLELYKKSVLGATVEWDLYVFEVTEWQKSEAGQELEDGEEIEADTWISTNEAKQMILDGKMQEERIALILLQWISQNE